MIIFYSCAVFLIINGRVFFLSNNLEVTSVLKDGIFYFPLVPTKKIVYSNNNCNLRLFFCQKRKNDLGFSSHLYSIDLENNRK